MVASLQRHLDPTVGSYWATVYQNVKSIEKTGGEVTVTLTKPDSHVQPVHGGQPRTIESAETLATAGKDYGNPTKGVNCTGPFAFDSWASGQSITLKRYDDYWDPDLKAKSGEVKFVFMRTRTPGSTPGSPARSTAAGGPRQRLRPAEDGGPGKVYFGVNTR